MIGRFRKLQEKYRRYVLVGFVVLATITFGIGQVYPPANKILTSTGVLTYLTLLVVMDIALSVDRLTSSRSDLRVSEHQDTLMSELLAAAERSADSTADLLEYAGVSTTPLIRKLRDSNVTMRILIKNPHSCALYQRRRTMSNLEALYGSVLDGYDTRFEIRCYSAPFTLRGRRIGSRFLELGWLTHDFRRDTAFGRANPSIWLDPKRDGGQHLVDFFNRTFEDLWNHRDTVDGRSLIT